MKRVILFIVFIILLLVGFGKSYVDVESLSAKDFEYNKGIIYSLEKLPSTIGASESLKRGEEDLISNIFSGLVELNDKGEPIPDLAMGWKVSEDGLEYTFNISEKNKWSNGKEITAKDFQIFFRDLLSKDNKDYISHDLYSIYGVKDYREGKIDFSEVAISSPDDYTLVFRMNNKDDNLLKNLAKPIYRLRDLNEPLDNYREDFSKISYTGPYIIYGVTDKGFIKLKDNPYNSSELKIKEITFKEKDSDEIELASFNLEKVDILKNPPIIHSGDVGLYKNLSKYNNDILKLMVINSENLEEVQGLSDIMKILISRSNISKNNLVEPHIKVVNNVEELSKIKNEGIKEDYKLNEFEENNIKNRIKEIFNNRENLKIAIEDNEEDKALANEIKKFLDKELSIKSIVKVYEDNIEDIINKGEFDVAFREINLSEKKLNNSKREDKKEENAEDNESKKEEGEEDKDSKSKEDDTLKGDNLRLVSLYFKNDIWCKSKNVNYLFIDGNGNLILKYSS